MEKKIIKNTYVVFFFCRFYTWLCDKIEKYGDKEFLRANFGDEFSEEDIDCVSDMFEKAKVLVKSRNNQNKKHK